MNRFETYRLYRRKPVGVSSSGTLMPSKNSSLLLSSNFSPTTITFKARNEKEAMKKANKFWQDGNFGEGSIAVKKD